MSAIKENTAQAIRSASKFLPSVCRFAFILIVVFQVETFANPVCSMIFSDQQQQSGNQRVGSLFLHEQNSKLHTSSMVEKTSGLQNRLTGARLTKPADKINNWLNYLNRLAEKAEQSPRVLKQLSEVLYKQFIIKSDEVPQSYYDLQVKIARERGNGNIVVTDAMKIQIADSLMKDQKASLDSWTEYLVSGDTSMYPMWLKYWMFNNMTKLSKFDPQSGSFGNRTKETVAPFPELNREALAYVADLVLRKLNKESLTEINDPALLNLLDGLNFGKIYGHTLFRLGVGKEGQFKTNEGEWIVYKKGSDHLPLVKSLEGKNTGWCTAGESTAKSQLAGGDFHVYYSRDAEGKFSIPRVAVRMQGKQIGEVRGVAKNQNLDKQINESVIVSNKLKEFGSEADKYIEKESHMRWLTEIERKIRLGQEVTRDDLVFLYELEKPIKGFGHGKDPRIAEIQAMRDLRSDIAILYRGKYLREEISLTVEEAVSGKYKLHYGDLNLEHLTSARGIKLPAEVIGTISLHNLSSAEGLVLPEIVHGGLILSNLTSARGLVLPKRVGSAKDPGASRSTEEIFFPKSYSNLDLSGLVSARDLLLPGIINGGLNLSSLKSAENLKFPETIQGGLYLGELVSTKDLILPKSVHGTLNLNALESPAGLVLPSAVYGDLIMYKLQSGAGLKTPVGANLRTRVSLDRLR